MKFQTATKGIGNPRVTFSRLGYHPGNNQSFERRAGSGRFPRFHVYLKELGELTEVSIHLDAKPHSYQGFSAHVGEYDTEIVQQETERLRTALQENAQE